MINDLQLVPQGNLIVLPTKNITWREFKWIFWRKLIADYMENTKIKVWEALTHWQLQRVLIVPEQLSQGLSPNWRALDLNAGLSLRMLECWPQLEKCYPTDSGSLGQSLLSKAIQRICLRRHLPCTLIHSTAGGHRASKIHPCISPCHGCVQEWKKQVR